MRHVLSAPIGIPSSRMLFTVGKYSGPKAQTKDVEVTTGARCSGMEVIIINGVSSSEDSH
jgi:hypothetical protein